jgi:hypothetical protein
MLPNNFADLMRDHPELSHVWSRLDDWVRKHPTRRVIDPKALARNLRDVSPQQLMAALQVLVSHKLIRPVFVIEAPNGQILSGIYDSPMDVPNRVPGTFEEWIETDDASIVPAYVEVGTRE